MYRLYACWLSCVNTVCRLLVSYCFSCCHSTVPIVACSGHSNALLLHFYSSLSSNQAWAVQNLAALHLLPGSTRWHCFIITDSKSIFPPPLPSLALSLLFSVCCSFEECERTVFLSNGNLIPFGRAVLGKAFGSRLPLIQACPRCMKCGRNGALEHSGICALPCTFTPQTDAAKRCSSLIHHPGMLYKTMAFTYSNCCYKLGFRAQGGGEQWAREQLRLATFFFCLTMSAISLTLWCQLCFPFCVMEICQADQLASLSFSLAVPLPKGRQTFASKCTKRHFFFPRSKLMPTCFRRLDLWAPSEVLLENCAFGIICACDSIRVVMYYLTSNTVCACRSFEADILRHFQSVHLP